MLQLRMGRQMQVRRQMLWSPQYPKLSALMVRLVNSSRPQMAASLKEPILTTLERLQVGEHF